MPATSESGPRSCAPCSGTLLTSGSVCERGETARRSWQRCMLQQSTCVIPCKQRVRVAQLSHCNYAP